MSTKINWTQFNNHLLDRIEQEEKGPFYNLFNICLDVCQDNNRKILGHGESETTFEIPKRLENYGKGDISYDMSIINYFNEFINLFFNESLSAKQYRSLYWKNKPILPKDFPKELHPDIKKYMVMLQGIYLWYMWMDGKTADNSEWEDMQYTLGPIEYENDFYFFGTVAILDEYLLKYKNRFPFASGFFQYFRSPPRFFNIDVKDLINPSQSNSSFVLPLANLPENLEKDQGSVLMQLFRSINKSRLFFNKSNRTITTLLPSILSSSSFIWKGKLGENLSPEMIEAMPQEKRLRLLMENKAEIMTRCFEELVKNFNNAKSSTKQEALNYLLLPVKEITSLLTTIDGKRAKQMQALQTARNLKKTLLALGEEFGENEANTTKDILLLLDKYQVDLPHKKQEPFIQKTLRLYRDSIIEEANLRYQIVDLEKMVADKRKVLEERFFHLKEGIEKEYFGINRYSYSVLQVYTTFSFILLNKDLFPTISLKKEVKQTAAQKMASWMKKITFKNAFSPSAEKREFDPQSLFQEIINKRTKNLLETYQHPLRPIKMEDLSKEQLEGIEKTTKIVATALKNGNQSSVNQFLIIEKALGRLLSEDHVFLKPLMDKDKITRKSITALYAHIEACLYFVDPQATKELKPRGEMFSKIFNMILKNVTKDGIKKDLEREVETLQKSFKTFSLPTPSLSNILEKELLSQPFDQLENKELQLVKERESMNPNVEKLKNIYQTLQNYIKEFLYSRKVGGYDLQLLYTKLELSKKIIPTSEQIKSSFKGIDWKLIEGLLPVPRERTNLFAIESLKNFIVDNQLSIEQSSSSIVNWDPRKANDLLFAALCAQSVKDKSEQLENENLQYSLVPKSDPLSSNRVNIFQNKTFFTAFGQKIIQNQRNSTLAESAYWEFLPLFLASFVRHDASLKDETFEKLRLDLLETLPGAKVVYEDLKNWMDKNQKSIQQLDKWLDEETKKNLNALQNSSQGITAFIEEISKKAMDKINTFVSLVSNFLSGTKEYLLISSVLSGGLLLSLAKYGVIKSGMGFVGNLVGSVILSFSVGALWMGYAKPYIQSLISKAIENYRYYFTEEYSKTSPNNYILKILMSAFNNEIGAFGYFKDLPEKLQFTNYLQDFFQTVEVSKNNLMIFPNRIFQLLPNSVENGQFSVLALNFFYMLNKEVFQIVPPEILQRASHPLFKDAVKEFLNSYVSELQRQEGNFEGKKTLEYDQETPLSRYLRDQADRGAITLSFARDSAIGKILGRSSRFLIDQDQIIPYKQMNTNVLAENVSSIQDCFKEILVKRDLMKSRLNPIFQKISENYDTIQLDQNNTNQAIQGLVNSFQILRMGFEMSTNMIQINDYALVPRYSSYLQGSHENASSILTSPVIADMMKVLKKTADYATAMGYEEGMQVERSLKELQTIIDDYISHGYYSVPPTNLWSGLQNSLLPIIQELDRGKSTLAYPMLIEFSQNNNILMPMLSFEMFKEHLFSLYGEEGGLVIQTLNNAKISYLTGENLSLYFFDAINRGFSLSSSSLNTLEKVAKNFQNKELNRFMGRIERLQSNLLPSEERGMINSKPQWNRQSRPIQLHPGQNYIRPYQNQRTLPSGIAPQNLIGSNQNIGANTNQNISQGGTGEFNPQQLGDPNTIPNNTNTIPQNNMQQNIPINSINQGQGPVQTNPKNLQANVPINPNISQGSNPSANVPVNRSQENDISSNLPIPIFMPVNEEEAMREQNIENRIREEQMIMQDTSGKNYFAPVSNEVNEEMDLFNSENNQASFPSGGGIYPNPLRRAYEQQAPQDLPQPFPWGKAAGVAGGVALGAGLLGSLFKEKDDSEEKKKSRRT